MRTSSKLIQKYYHVKVGHKLAGIISQVDTVSLIAARLLGADFTAVFYRAENNDRLIPVSYQYGQHISVRHFELLESTWGAQENVERQYKRGITELSPTPEQEPICPFGTQNGFATRYLFPIYEEGRLSAVFMAYWYEPPEPVAHETEVMLDLVAGVLTAALTIADQLLVVENYSSRLSDLLEVFEAPLGELSFKGLVTETMERASLLVADSRSLLLSRSANGRLTLTEWFGGEEPSDTLTAAIIDQVEPITIAGADDTDTRRYRCRSLKSADGEEIGDMVALPVSPHEDVQLILVLLLPPGRMFTTNDRELLAVFGVFAQTVLRNALLFKRLRKANRLLERSSARLANAETMAALTDMTSGVAHDFNNIFGGIIGRVQLLKLRQQDPKVAEELDKIEKLVVEGAETVRRIQEFSTSGRPVEFRTVDLCHIFREAMNDQATRWYKLAGQKHIRIDFTCLDGSGPIEGAESDLGTIVRKLLENAVEHSHENGRISVRLEQDDRHYIIRVIDHGEGIEPDIRKKVFYPFFTTKTERGAGLGLAIVHGIVSRHHGEIAMTPTDGGGATFTVTLRRSDNQTDITDITGRIKVTKNNLKVLVVDDDEQIRDVLSDMLNINGHKTVTCADGYAALEAIDKERFDMLITDLGMPGMSGLDLAGEVHEKHPKMPIAMITGWGTQLNKEEVALKGIQAILPKPFHLKDIKQLVDDLVTA